MSNAESRLSTVPCQCCIFTVSSQVLFQTFGMFLKFLVWGIYLWQFHFIPILHFLVGFNIQILRVKIHSYFVFQLLLTRLIAKTRRLPINMCQAISYSRFHVVWPQCISKFKVTPSRRRQELGHTKVKWTRSPRVTLNLSPAYHTSDNSWDPLSSSGYVWWRPCHRSPCLAASVWCSVIPCDASVLVMLI